MEREDITGLLRAARRTGNLGEVRGTEYNYLSLVIRSSIENCVEKTNIETIDPESLLALMDCLNEGNI